MISSKGTFITAKNNLAAVQEVQWSVSIALRGFSQPACIMHLFVNRYFYYRWNIFIAIFRDYRIKSGLKRANFGFKQLILLTIQALVTLLSRVTLYALVYNAFRIFALYSHLMILALAQANASLTNKGECPRVYDPARFNKREAKRLGEILGIIVPYRIVSLESRIYSENCKSKLDSTIKLWWSTRLYTNSIPLSYFSILKYSIKRK